MSIRLLGIWDQRRQIIHTAVDDLESFLWVLVWVIAHILKGNQQATAYNRGIKMVLKSCTGDLAAQQVKETYVETWWKDVVFGKLFKRWIAIFREARQELELFLPSFELSEAVAPVGAEVWVRLEQCCMRVYEDVLESGFQHLEGVRSYTSWDDVVAAR
jgi:hypothetical protein